MYSKFLCVGLVALFAVAWVGCDDEETNKPDWCDRCPGGIFIVTGTPNDTLFYLPNDSASTPATIIVIDKHGLAMPGQKVDVSLSDPSLGVIEFTDRALVDTTNSLGRVNTIFRSYGIEGQIIISATTSGLTVSDTLIIRERPQAISSVTFETDCDSLIALPDRPDSCEICVTLRDVNNNPVVGVSLNMSATGGRFQIPPVTDEYGRSCFYMYLDDGTFGDYCVIVNSDSLCFSLPG